LYRVLRLLTAVGVFAEDDQGRFALTPLGACLQTGVPGSVRAWALILGSPEFMVPLAHLLYSVQTGAPAFDHIHGIGLFEYFPQHPAFGAVFNAGEAERTAAVAPTVAAAYDFSRLQTVVDVGGSHGILLAAILQAHPTVHGVVFDLPHVVEGARGPLAAAGVMQRCEVVGGDFFVAVPHGGDAYLLANVVHDWEDERAVVILRNCCQAMAQNGKVLLVERLLPTDGPRPLPTLVSDLAMLVGTGGRERTEAEYGQLFAAAGLRLTQVIPVLPPYGVIEAVRA
jgi:hypothetical protein